MTQRTYHLYDLGTMGSNTPEEVTLSADHDTAVQEVIDANSECWNEVFGRIPVYGEDFRLEALPE